MKVQLIDFPEYTFVGEYRGYTKEPDLTLIPMLGPDWDTEAAFPSIVLETGWTESVEKLREDVTLWQQGSGGAVRIVFQVKFYPRSYNRIGTRLWINRATPPTKPFGFVKTKIEEFVSLFPIQITYSITAKTL